VGLFEAQALLDGVLVDLVDHGVDGLTVQRVVGLRQPALGPGVRYLLDQDDDVHARSGPLEDGTL
jgi:hypothetical protein